MQFHPINRVVLEAGLIKEYLFYKFSTLKTVLKLMVVQTYNIFRKYECVIIVQTIH